MMCNRPNNDIEKQYLQGDLSIARVSKLWMDAWLLSFNSDIVHTCESYLNLKGRDIECSMLCK